MKAISPIKIVTIQCEQCKFSKTIHVPVKTAALVLKCTKCGGKLVLK